MPNVIKMERFQPASSVLSNGPNIRKLTSNTGKSSKSRKKDGKFIEEFLDTRSRG